jgi:hypothetical protein
VPHFTYTAPLDDDCHFPVVAEWSVHYHTAPYFSKVMVHITKCELDAVRVYMTPDVGLLVQIQTIDYPASHFETELRKKLDMDLLYELAFADYQKFPDAGRDVA